MRTYSWAIAMIAAIALAAADVSPQALGKALTFHAGFDGGIDARFGLGNKRIYTAASYKEQGEAKPGIEGTDV